MYACSKVKSWILCCRRGFLIKTDVCSGSRRSILGRGYSGLCQNCCTVHSCSTRSLRK